MILEAQSFYINVPYNIQFFSAFFPLLLNSALSRQALSKSSEFVSLYKFCLQKRVEQKLKRRALLLCYKNLLLFFAPLLQVRETPWMNGFANIARVREKRQVQWPNLPLLSCFCFFYLSPLLPWTYLSKT